ncbi:hypothetical protein A3Q56_02937 [Intoshia linei]|uniref:Uracil-DNA glycosylase n=1 Tax=Intoshia linei TaxID=1819745 RepID=A0A177B6R8_9BILA|nr:hypothetical protein A3Q56_02937 [Intoshia linei]
MKKTVKNTNPIDSFFKQDFLYKPAVKKSKIDKTKKIVKVAQYDVKERKEMIGFDQVSIFENLLSGTWKFLLKDEFDKPYFRKLSLFLTKESQTKTIYPPVSEIFSWSQYCDINDIKVVIIGQDPYHGKGQAHGLCFSVKKGIKPPPSLKNMYKCIGNDFTNFKKPKHGYLLNWAKQGVLLLNAVLTVEASKANSHAGKGWEIFTDEILRNLIDHFSNKRKLIFLLWGAYAQKKTKNLNLTNHYLLKSVHPSPLSAHRGFFNCQHFLKTNELLSLQNLPIIDWNVD